jgi:signal transduction histidine kinase
MANFKTRARALDLLGRQQIAGIPTAINELLKNAHDAYADNVDIDYFRKDNLFILRDDGLGMTKEDFITRWLTLGTESKLTNRKTTLPPIDESKSIRITMGEKGIGRLAIASIGKQVLILSKANRKEIQHKIIAALINWEIFEIPGLNLEDVIVPIREFDTLPSSSEIEGMKDELLSSLTNLLEKDDITQEEADSISRTIRKFSVSPQKLNTDLVGDYPMEGHKGGTFFYVSPVDEILDADIDGNRNPKDATKIEKMLIGFHNTMTPNHPKPILNITFRDFRSDNRTYYSIIDKEQFFTKEDFELADHHFEGKFDEFGQFRGMVKIYREKTFDHIVNWSANNFKETTCGAFSINLAYVQGVKKDSIIDSENYNRITAKADKFGGLYVYKDNIRILPYGDSDYDYLDIEKNRTKRAATAFFSYRRMFGVININHESNNNLKEKAGREGFIENKAFKQLQDILKNFFVQLAADFFREDTSASPKAEAWSSKRQELQSAHKALERREKQAKVRKDKFEKEVERFFYNLNKNLFEIQVKQIIDNAKMQFDAISSLQDHDIASQRLLDVEFQTRRELADFKKSIIIPSPKGFIIKKDLRDDYNTYLNEFSKIENDLLVPANNQIDELVDNTIKKLDLELSKRKRLEQAVDFISLEAKKINTQKKVDLNNSVGRITKRVKELTTDLMIDLDDQIRSVKDKFKTLNYSEQSDFNLVEKRMELENEIQTVSERNTFILDTIIRQLEGIYWEKDENNKIITNDQITDALGEELDDLRERIQTDIELSQLGLAVGVIHHEFSSTIKAVRSSLKDLKAWSDVHGQLEGVYKNIKINFEHLDGYLNLFTPLNRRLNRNREEIKALEIKTFLIDLFKTRMDRHGIVFKHTHGFAKAKLFGFRSSFYPVFVNIIDNAIYWLNKVNTEEKVIRLHADNEGIIYVSNNGLPIPIQDNSKIFNLGFTRKENGRGMGLHISKEVLGTVGYDISLDTPREYSTVTFKIEPIKTENNE